MPLLQKCEMSTRKRFLTALMAAIAAPCWAALAGASAAASPGAGDWPQMPHDFANTRFSPLAQITPANASQAQAARELVHRHQARPRGGADRGGRHDVPGAAPGPTSSCAFDLTKPGLTIKWRYEPQPKPFAQGVACCDIVNRGAAYADGRVFINTLDGQTIAVDAATGKELWRRQLGDIHDRRDHHDGAARRQGQGAGRQHAAREIGVRGWLTALDAATGATAWRA